MSAPRTRRAANRILPLTLFAALFLASLSPAARAATFTVTSLADDGSPGTLRAAIADAQASTDVNDTITITAQGTITLTGGELLLSNPNGVTGKAVTVTGPGAGTLFVSGGHAPNSTGANGSRVFHFSGLTVAMSGVAVIHGFVNSGTQSAGGVVLGGAGILAEGATLTMGNCVVEDCLVNLAGAFGGGVAGANTALTLTHCVITSDSVSAFNGGGGSGIGSLLGSLTMTDCTVDYNDGSGLGGGIGSLNEPLTLTRCAVADNGVLNTNQGNADGGGIYSQSGAVTLTDCTVSSNDASSAGNGLYLKYGSATLQGCTISDNQSSGGLTQQGFVFDGGGLNIAGAVVGITNCTFTGNSADLGGAIYNQGGTLTLSNSTVARNSGGSAGGTTGAGLFIASGATATVTSTILTGNSTFHGESDVTSQGTVTSGGSNLLGDADGNGFADGVGHDQTGVTSPGLSYTLADNGGPTPTLALTAGSPAIDADYADATSTDQRGAARPAGARNDIGAYESGVTVPSVVPDTFTVTNTNDDGDGSLRRAVNNADAAPGANVVFDPGVFGVPRTITLTSGPLIVRQAMAITGPGQRLLAVSGNHASGVLDIEGGDHAISGLTITGGHGTSGGGVFAAGPLTMTDCTITGNTAGGQDSIGGGLFVEYDATLTRCTITNNSAPNGSSAGGGVCNYYGSLTMTDCTVAGNSAALGGGIFTSGGAFPALTGCTLSGNSASTGGGAYSGGSLFLTDCTVSGNTATSGGGLDTPSGGLIILSSSTVSANRAGTGGGLNVESGGTTLVGATILAGNSGSANVVSAGTLTSQGSNLVGDPDGSGFTGGTNADQTGVTNPMLGPLQNNGGPTQTMALLAGSPAIDADFRGFSATDQRGAARPVGARSDIGAYEYGALFAVDDAYAVAQNTTLSVPATGVLANDTADGSALTAAVQAPPAHGQLTLNADGSFTYTPATGYLGPDAFTYQAQEAGGRTGTATVTLTVTALQPPTTAASLSGTQGSSGYYRSAVTVTLTATDLSGGAGGAITTSYAVDGGAAQAYSGPFTVSGDGPHTVTFSSAGAQSGPGPSGSVTFKIDATPPTLTFGTPTPAAGASGYANAPVSVPYTTADATSGIASATPGGPVRFTMEGAHQTQTVTVTDNAGNSAPFTTPTVSIDLTAPATTAASQSTANGQQVTLSATDALSGVASTTYRVDGGASTSYTGPFTVSGSGSHTVTFSSTDNAGNAEAAQTLTLTVAPVTPPVLHTFAAGLQLFAVAESYVTGTALSPAPARLAVWNPTLLQYTLSDGASALAPGQGYWARFAQATALYDAGTPPPAGQPFTVTLKKGWNMIGDPFPSPVSLGNAQVAAGGQTYAGLSDASKAGVVAFTLYGYPPDATHYQTQSGDAPMAPYQGYWLHAFTDCTLQIGAP